MSAVLKSKNILITILIFVAMIATTVISGWYLQKSILIQISDNFVPMQFNTAICFLLSALATIFLILQKKKLSILLAIALLILAGLSGVQYLIGQDFGIDQIFMDAYLLVHTTYPGRMGISTSICFALVGIIVISQNRANNLWFINHSVMVVIAIALLSFIGYLGNINTAYVWGNMSGMAVHTAFNFIILGAVIFIHQILRDQNKTSIQSWHIAPTITACLILFLGFWQSLESFQIQQIEKQIQRSTQAVIKTIRLSLEVQNAELVQLIEFSEEYIINTRNEADDNIVRYFNSHNDILSVNWVDENNTLKWSLSRNEINITPNLYRINESLATASKETLNRIHEAQIVWEKLDSNDISTYYLIYPLYYQGKYYGTINISYLTKDLIPKYVIQSEIFATYLISLYSEKNNVYRSFSLDFLKKAKTYSTFNTLQYSQTFPIFDQQLTIKVQPSPELIEDNLSSLPKFILVMGIMMSLLVAYSLTARIKEQEANLQSEKRQKEIINIQQQSIIEHEKLEKSLLQSNEELDKFAYIASHDLKSPLRGIAQVVSWVEEDLQDTISDEINGHLTLIKNRINRLESLLNDLLDYSRVGRLHGDFIELDPKQFILEIFQLSNPPKEFQCAISTKIQTINTLHVPLALIIRNLVSNAIKHHNRKDGILNITISDQPKFIEFIIKDDGPGIAPQYHEKIFEVFQTLNSRDKVEGSGIGLSIIKKLVKNYNASLNLKSDGISGSTFILHWPKAQTLQEVKNASK